MITLIEVVIATCFTLLFSTEKGVDPQVTENLQTEKICQVYFSGEC